jgi:hypothetical protein
VPPRLLPHTSTDSAGEELSGDGSIEEKSVGGGSGEHEPTSGGSGGEDSVSGGSATTSPPVTDPATTSLVRPPWQRAVATDPGLDPAVGFLLFLFFFINRGGHQTTSENRPFTVTFDLRGFVCPPRKVIFAGLG